MTKTKATVLLIFMSALFGCGSGDDDETNGTQPVSATDPTTDFFLYPQGYFVAGYSEIYTLAGTDSEGRLLTGSCSIRTQPETLFNGNPAIPIEFSQAIEFDANPAFISRIGIEYYSVDILKPELLGRTDITFDETTELVVTASLPFTASIGESGSVGTYTTGDVNIVTLWRIDDGGNGNAELVFSSLFTDSLTGAAITTEDITYLIDEDGERISLQVRISDLPSGITVNFSGDNELGSTNQN